MKKSLVALAALAAAGAYAQSSVQITGYMDRGYTTTQRSDFTSTQKTLGSQAGTTRIEFRVNEDLGGGNSAGFFVETDWNDVGGFGSNQTISSSAPNAATGTSATTVGVGSFTFTAPSTLGLFANSENFISFKNAGLGQFKFGTPNSAMFEAVNQVGQGGFSTGIGSIYSTGFSIHGGVGTGGNSGGSGSVPVFQTNVNTTVACTLNTSGACSTTASQTQAVGAAGGSVGQRSIRQANTINYETNPLMGGLVLKAAYAPKNDIAYNTGAGAGAAYTVGVTEYSLRYNQPKWNVVYATIKYDVGGNYNVWLSGTPQAQLLNAYAGALGGAGKFSQTNTYTAGNYEVINGLKVYAGRATSKATDQTVVNLSSTNYGASYTMGQVDLLVNAAKVDDKSTVNADRKLTGLGANYNLSKTTRAYYRYDKINYNTNSTSGINQTRNAVGLSMSF